MGQRRQVTARAYRAFLWNHRDNPAVVQLAKKLDHGTSNSAKSERQDVGPQQNHGAHLGLREWLADAAGMAPNQVELELPQFRGRNMNVGQFPKACADAVNDPALGDDIFDGPPGRIDAGARGSSNLQANPAVRDPGDF